MIDIKFSHMYWKMPTEGLAETYLIGVSRIAIEKLPKSFIKYDTAYDPTANYPLPEKGEYMVLTLWTADQGELWTTIRRWTPEKEKYYQEHLGEKVGIVFIKEEGKP